MFNQRLCILPLIIMLRITHTETTNKEYMQRLEKSLLQMFGLEEKPKVDKSTIKIPPHMFDLYNKKVVENQEDMEGNARRGRSFENPEEISNTVRSFTHSELQSEELIGRDGIFLRFDVDSIPVNEILKKAKLRVMHFQHPQFKYMHLNASQSSPNNTSPRRRKWSRDEVIYLHRLNIYDVIRPSKGSLHDPIYKLLDSRIIDARVNETVSLDVSANVFRWLRKPQSNHGLYVQINPLNKTKSVLNNDISHIRIKRDLNARESTEWENEQPLLVVYTDDKNIKPKEKRSTAKALKRIQCQRYNLYVDFRKVDWDSWIVAPSGYHAFFCQGDCPYPLSKHMNATNHAVIQNIIHARYPNRVPSACCVPTKHSAISMLYLDRDQKVVLKTYQNMVVESCGCQ